MTNKKQGILFLFLTLLISFSCFGQHEKDFANALDKIAKTANSQPLVALKSLDSLKKNSKHLTQSEQISLNEIYAFSYYYNADFEHSKQYFFQALSESEALKDTLYIGKMYNNLGVLYVAFAKYDSALYYYNKSLEIKQKKNDSINIAKTLMNMANVYNREGYFITATQYYYKTLKIFEALKMKKEQAYTLNNIGTCQKSRMQFVKADSSLKKSYRIFSELNNSEGKLTVLINIGSVQMGSAKIESAKGTFNQVLQLAQKEKDSLSMAFAYINLGQIAISETKWEEAKKYNDISARLFQNNRYKEQYISSIGYGGIILFHLGQVKKGLQLLDSSYHKLMNIKRFPLALKMGKDYAKYLMQSGDFKNAYLITNKVTELQDRIYNDKQALITHDIEAKYHFERQQKEIELGKKKLEALHAEKSLQESQFRLYSVFSGGLLLLLIGLIFFIFYRNNQKKKAHKLILEHERFKNEALSHDLKNKNKELTNFALHISEKKQFLQTINNEIRKAKTPEENKQIYIRIMQNLQSDKESETLFQEVNTFLSKFRIALNNYKELTKKDIRLCTLIQLGLSSKEIAAIFNISSKSVDMQRYRLRKKANIPSEVTIEEWLESINSH